MDYEKILEEIKQSCLKVESEKNTKIALIQAKKILKKIKIEKRKAKEQLYLEESLPLIENELVNNENSYYILWETGDKLPVFTITPTIIEEYYNDKSEIINLYVPLLKQLIKEQKNDENIIVYIYMTEMVFDQEINDLKEYLLQLIPYLRRKKTRPKIYESHIHSFLDYLYITNIVSKYDFEFHSEQIKR